MPNVVVIGAVNGRFKEVFAKVATLHAKNAFALAIIAGDLFLDPAISTDEDAQNLDDLLNNRIEIALSVYFTLGSHPLPPQVIDRLESNNGELCSNLYFLGKRTTTKTSEGIRVVALGGSVDLGLTVAASKDKYTPFCSVGDANSLKGANKADILITHHWPTDIQTGSKKPLPTSSSISAEPSSPTPHTSIAELSARLQPRYHFSTSSNFWEREPFFHTPPADAQEKGYATTRFISLAPFGNTTKQKWIYAFALDPSASNPLTVPAGTTASPFAFLASKSANESKRALPSQAQSFSRFAQADSQGGSHTHHHRNKRQKHTQPPPDPSTCFFCLSSPTLSAHLVVSIGTEAYLTTARGPLPTATTFAPFLSGGTSSKTTLENGNEPNASPAATPLHVLIIPMSHHPVLSTITPLSSRTATIHEMHAYRRALNAMIASQSGNRLGSVCWEISRAGGVHAHWQYLAVDGELVGKGLVEAGMRVEAENQGFEGMTSGRRIVDRSIGGNGGEEEEEKKKEKEKEAELEDEEQVDRGDFFRVWIWRPSSRSQAANGDVDNDAAAAAEEVVDLSETKTLLLPLPSSEDRRFDLQFGRRVMAKLMDLEARLNWRDCGQSEAEETRDAEAFKDLFKGFDFTLQEEEEG